MPESVTLDIAAAVALLFGVPAGDVLAQAFAFAFLTPLGVYLTAYYVGIFVNFWRN
jgi:hypothetical protein